MNTINLNQEQEYYVMECLVASYLYDLRVRGRSHEDKIYGLDMLIYSPNSIFGSEWLFYYPNGKHCVFWRYIHNADISDVCNFKRTLGPIFEAKGWTL